MNIVNFTNSKLKSHLLELGFSDWTYTSNSYSCNLLVGPYYIYITNFMALNDLTTSIWHNDETHSRLFSEISYSENLIEDFISALESFLSKINLLVEGEMIDFVIQLKLFKIRHHLNSGPPGSI